MAAADDDTTTPPTTSGIAPGVARDHGRAGRNLPAAIGVGVGLFLLLVVTLGWFNLGFVIIMAAALTLGAVEVSQAMSKVGIRTAIIPIAVGTVAIIIGSYLAHVEERVNSNLWMLGILGLTVLISLVWRMPGGSEGYVRDASGSMLIIGWIPLLGAFASMMLAGDQGPMRVITFLVVIVLSDTGGYAVGVLFGKHPMAPRISPKKSWEGFAGSIFFGTAGAVFMMVVFLDRAWWTGVVLGVGLVLAAACGDLVESLVKRDIGIKDMSSFLPGHGGVMDRLDSLLLAAPVGWLILLIFVPGG